MPYRQPSDREFSGQLPDWHNPTDHTVEAEGFDSTLPELQAIIRKLINDVSESEDSAVDDAPHQPQESADAIALLTGTLSQLRCTPSALENIVAVARFILPLYDFEGHDKEVAIEQLRVGFLSAEIQSQTCILGAGLSKVSADVRRATVHLEGKSRDEMRYEISKYEKEEAENRQTVAKLGMVCKAFKAGSAVLSTGESNSGK